MEKIVLEDAKEKFLKARELCPGKPETMYFITDYIGIRIGDRVTPLDLIDQILDVATHLIGAGSIEDQDVYSLMHLLKIKFYSTEVKKQMSSFPQVVDALADEKFASVFRKFWDSCLVGSIFEEDPKYK